MKRSFASVALFLLICIGIAVVGYMRYSMESGAPVLPEPTASASPAPTATPAPAPTAAPTPTPEPTPEPTEEPSPAPTEEPTAEPSASPEPSAEPEPEPSPAGPSGTGSFRSDTGTFLNLVVKYTVKENGGQPHLVLEAYAETYALQTVEMEKGLCFSVNGRTTYRGVEAIRVGDTRKKVEYFIGSMETDVKSGSTVNLEVSWQFRGSIGGKYLDVLRAEASVEIP